MSEALPERGEGGRFLPRTPEGAMERSPERQRLAEAIEYLGALDQQLQRLAEARSRLDLWGRERALDAARVVLEEAKKRAPEALVAKMMGEEFDPAQTVDHAQGLLEDAQRDRDEARAADALLADEIALAQRRAVARLGRDTALREVLQTAPEVTALRDRIEQTRRQLYEFSWICSAIGLRRLPPGFHWDGVLWGPDRGSGAPWKAALMALETDPDAELPIEK